MTYASSPFEFVPTVRDDLFADRIQETQRLITNFRLGVNTILISPRRMGKTSLVIKAQSLATSDTLRIASMDIFGCRSPADFLTAYAAAVVKAAGRKTDNWLRTARQFLSALAPEITFGNDPQNQFSLRFGIKDLPQRTEDILNLPERIALHNKVRIVVCIDEFQQIGLFEDSLAFQKLLCSVWQHHSQVSYCLYGRHKHMMDSIFQTSSAPFYRFGDLFNLDRIPREDWVSFIVARFNATGKSISEAIAGRIADTADRYSYYVQQLAFHVWTSTASVAGEAEFQRGVDLLLASCEPTFIEQTVRLTNRQMNFLHALSDGLTSGFSEKAVLDRYDLTSSSNVIRVREALLEKDMILQPARGTVLLVDPILKLWLQRRVWPS